MDEIKALMGCTPETLAEKQFKALLAFTVGRLKEVADGLRARDWDRVRGLTFYSPAGDGMGLDNSCIDFSWYLDDKDHDPMDIHDITDRLEELAKLCEKGGKKTKK